MDLWARADNRPALTKTELAGFQFISFPWESEGRSLPACRKNTGEEEVVGAAAVVAVMQVID